ncbi:MAG: hypothetical protein J5I94_28430 [Phaeodactylibacter sp.]|nr:hypothetical protein [Phaeodactylibacter sp.]
MITRTLKTLAVILAATTTIFAVPKQPTGTIFDHFLQDGILEFTLETDLTELIENRRTEDYLPAKFTFEDREGREFTQEIKVKPRGKFRRRVCNFPPLMLNFSKGALEEKGYIPEYDKLKLVSHCIDDKNDSKEHVMKEYLAYKLFNELTGQSYRVQLAKVTYIDSKGSLGKIKRYGFIIEDTDEMAQRLGGEECEDCRGLGPATVAQESENLMAVFQYMIGNSDWNLNMMRNLKMVKPYDGGPVIPVPYDFDFAGMVNAPYAIPNSEIGQLTIRQRVFQGMEADQELFLRTLQYFMSKKESLIDEVRRFRELSGNSRREIIDYLDTFFLDVEAILEGKQPIEPSLQEAIRQQPQPAEESGRAGSSYGK